MATDPRVAAEPSRTASLTGADAAAVRALAQAAEEVDGIEALSEQTLLNLEGAERHLTHLLTRAPSGQVVGYAQHDSATASAELAVHPGSRRQGIGGQLLDAVLDIAPGSPAVWAHGDLLAAQALARSRQLRRVRDLWVMTAAPPTAAPEMPHVEGLRVRTFEVGRDEDAWLAVNALAFADHPEQGRLTRADLEQREAQPWFDPDVFYLAEDVNTGELLGSLWVKIEGNPGHAVGEIYALGVHPQAQGRGVGGLLTAHAMAAFAAHDLARIELYVEGENAPAIRTYTRAGFTRERADVQYAR
ncbi:mycothiol synthase [Ruania halotolerans]|uniref:mycothiol synthase n=1 Tax=Ruania halotolerans TaxID=2897773 RepID=UPI001E3EA17D|nr:mycothiol synthase [Ruania halotolerans]UFU05933.1 mycothiol synthase [Ruania halotolerans]